MGKYKRDKGLQIPMEQRQNLNAKILYLVENHETELYGITPEDIFYVRIIILSWFVVLEEFLFVQNRLKLVTLKTLPVIQ